MFPSTTKFILVDDLKSMRKIIKRTLFELGYTNIAETNDGTKALPLLQKAAADGSPFEFIISDWNTPGMTGIDLLKACRADPQLKSVPFMLITAESNQQNIMEAAKAGVSDYLVKPFTSAMLKEKLTRVYTKTRAASKKAS